MTREYELEIAIEMEMHFSHRTRHHHSDRRSEMENHFCIRPHLDCDCRDEVASCLVATSEARLPAEKQGQISTYGEHRRTIRACHSI